MTEGQLRRIWRKTHGRCHFCGDPVVFAKRGWHEGNLKGFWEVDHIRQRDKGGTATVENCLPACTRCNRLRWHRTGAKLRELLELGLVAKSEINRGTEVGRTFLGLWHIRSQQNAHRRTHLSLKEAFESVKPLKRRMSLKRQREIAVEVPVMRRFKR